jgi:hypothetical protein
MAVRLQRQQMGYSSSQHLFDLTTLIPCRVPTLQSGRFPQPLSLLIARQKIANFFRHSIDGVILNRRHAPDGERDAASRVVELLLAMGARPTPPSHPQRPVVSNK